MKFDLCYLWLIFPLLRFFWSWLTYRCNILFTVPFMCVWYFFILSKPRRFFDWRTPGLTRCAIGLAMVIALYKLLPTIYAVPKFEGGPIFEWRSFLSGVVTYIFMLSIVVLSISRNKIKELKAISWLILFVVVWNGIAAVMGGKEVADIGSGRLMSNLAQARLNQYVDDYQLNVVAGLGMANSYWQYHSAFLIPMFILMAWRGAGLKLKIIAIGAMICCFLTIKNGGLTTPLMIVAIGLLLLAIYLMSRSRVLTYLCGVSLAIFMIVFSYSPKMFDFLGQPLRDMAEMCEDLPVFQTRFISAAEMVEGDLSTYAAKRYELQQLSFNSFVEGNWLMGCVGKRNKYNLAGHHSELLDHLALYGMVGLSCIVLYWVLFTKFMSYYCSMLRVRKWYVLSTVYTATWFFASVPNPVELASAEMFVSCSCFALFAAGEEMET